MPSRIRNKIIFLACLFVFAALGIVIYREWVVQKPFAVILFVSENLTPSQLSAARLFAGGADFRFDMESLPYLALAKTPARDYAVADAAAAATSLATGQTVNRGALAITPEGLTLASILETAKSRGRTTGLVSNTPLTDPALAAFYAKATDANDRNALALQLIDQAHADVILGGGAAQLMPEAQGGTRRDGRDLLLEMRQRGFDIVRTREELDNTPGWRNPQVFGIFADQDLAFAEDQSRNPSQPRLADLVRRAIELLQFNRKGYLLVVNAGLAGRAAQLGRGETLLREIGELDQAVSAARQYAGENALILVAGLGNTGGLQLNAYSFAADRGIAVLGPSSAGLPALTWSTGPAPKEDSAPLQAVSAPSDHPQPVAEDTLLFGTLPIAPPTDLPAVHNSLGFKL